MLCHKWSLFFEDIPAIADAVTSFPSLLPWLLSFISLPLLTFSVIALLCIFSMNTMFLETSDHLAACLQSWRGQRLMVFSNFAALALSFSFAGVEKQVTTCSVPFCHISSRCSKQIRPVYFCPLPPLEPGSWQRDGVCWWQQHVAFMFG